MASAAPDDSGRSAEIFEHCDRDLPDSAYDLQTTAAPDPRADAQHRSADGSRHSGAGFLNTVAPRARLEIACKASGRQNRADPSDHGQYWIEIFGEGEWLQVKHETKAKRKSWRKLDLGLDLTTGEIICSDLTLDHVGDSTALPGLLDQFDGPVSRFLADGAYDGTPTRNLLTARFGDASRGHHSTAKKRRSRPEIAAMIHPSRDQHIAQIQTYGRLAWQVRSGYNQRSRAEAQIGRLEKCDRAETEIAAVRKSEN